LSNSNTSAIEHDIAIGSHNLASRSFVALVITQFLTGINDNCFRWLVIGIGKYYIDADMLEMDQSTLLGVGLACFVSPYILLATHAGFISDRHSKRNVIICCKFAEILIMLGGTIAIANQNIPLIFVMLTLMGAQSAMFYPSKFGAIPEIVKESKISSANGVYNMATVGGTLLGMMLGMKLADLTHFKEMAYLGVDGIQDVWIIGSVVIGTAVVGTCFSLLIQRLEIAAPNKDFTWNLPKQMKRDVKTLARQPAMLKIAFGIAFFWAISAVAQNTIDQFVVEAGGGAEVDKTTFMVTIVLGVCAGSILAGILSAGRVELGLLPIGALGIAITSLLMFTIDSTIFDKTRLGAVVRNVAEDTSNHVPAEVKAAPPIKSDARRPKKEHYLGIVVTKLSDGMPIATDLRESDIIKSITVDGTKHDLSEGVERYRKVIEANLGKIASFETLRLPPGKFQIDVMQQVAEIESAKLSMAEHLDFDINLEQQSQIKTEFILACFFLFMIGVSSGFFEVPLTSYVQHRSPKKDLGAILAATNLITFVGMLVLNGIFVGLRQEVDGEPILSAREVFLSIGIATIPVCLYIVWLIPQTTIRFVVWVLSRTFYKIRLKSVENLPETGGALLVPNHVTWIDGILLLLASDRPVRMVVFSGNFRNPFIKILGKMFGVIFISAKKSSITKALDTAAKALDNGELVCIFPEGTLSKTGQVQAFRPGMTRILERTKTDVPVIPIYLDGLWGSIFSFDRGKYFWKLPKRIPYPVWIHFGPPLSKDESIHIVRQRVQDLGANAMNQRAHNESCLAADFIYQAKRNKKVKIADSSGAKLSGKGLLLKSLVVRNLLKRHAISDDEQYVGMLVPPTVAATVTNMALVLDRRIPVHLNYTVSAEVLNSCIEQCGIKHIISSRKAMEKFNFNEEDLNADIFYLEELKEDKDKEPTLGDKLSGIWNAFVTPAGRLIKKLKLREIGGDDIATVIFTSGSTGVPKGVMLTNGNVSSNIAAIQQVARIDSDDSVLGVLPFFHSFGFTVTLWGSMCLDMSAVFHTNPLDSRMIGKLCDKHGISILLATPTFLRSYLKRCTPEQMSTLDVAITGAEKLPTDLADAFEEKFGVRPVEGYGATETSPITSCNVPGNRATSKDQIEFKDGTVGRPIQGVVAKVLDLDTDEELGQEQSGMLYIKGPNIMKGYMGRDDLTAEVVQDGWYKTGDVALIDKDGFIKITGRMSRFSKIGGEMVPHIKVEEAINEILGTEDSDADDDDSAAGISAAVTSVPDDKKGERLIVLHTALSIPVEEIIKALSTDHGLPNIFIPSAESFMQVDEIPILGTGKLDLKGLKTKAEELTA